MLGNTSQGSSPFSMPKPRQPVESPGMKLKEAKDNISDQASKYNILSSKSYTGKKNQMYT
jgi:hypothetical protein